MADDTKASWATITTAGAKPRQPPPRQQPPPPPPSSPLLLPPHLWMPYKYRQWPREARRARNHCGATRKP